MKYQQIYHKSYHLILITAFFTVSFSVPQTFFFSPQDTPAPGAYDYLDFLEEQERNPVRTTFGFKNEGRRRQNWVAHEGKFLLPGAYNHQDFSYKWETAKNPEINRVDMRGGDREEMSTFDYLWIIHCLPGHYGGAIYTVPLCQHETGIKT